MPPPRKESPSQTPDIEGLKDALRDWWREETEDWDEEEDQADDDDCDLWDDLPVIDSKAVARTSPIFRRFLGRKLDLKKVRKGGYESVEDMIDDLVPKMVAASRSQAPRVGAEPHV